MASMFTFSVDIDSFFISGYIFTCRDIFTFKGATHIPTHLQYILVQLFLLYIIEGVY